MARCINVEECKVCPTKCTYNYKGAEDEFWKQGNTCPLRKQDSSGWTWSAVRQRLQAARGAEGIPLGERVTYGAIDSEAVQVDTVVVDEPADGSNEAINNLSRAQISPGARAFIDSFWPFNNGDSISWFGYHDDGNASQENTQEQQEQETDDNGSSDNNSS